MSRRKRYFNFETRRVERFVRKRSRDIPRTPEARRKEIVEKYALGRHSVDESWIVLGPSYGDWEVVSPEQQRRNEIEQRRIRTAKYYGVPVSWISTEEEMAKRRAASVPANSALKFLSILGSQALARLTACRKIIPTSLLRMGRKCARFQP